MVGFCPAIPGGRATHWRGNRRSFGAALVRAVTAADLRTIVKKLVELAKGGDVSAAKIIFDRSIGPPVDAAIEERLSRLEAAALGDSEE